MVGYKDTSDVVKKAAKVAQKKSNNWYMVSLIHNGSEITTWMGYSLKIKSKKSEQHSFLNFKLQIIRLAQGHWSC